MKTILMALTIAVLSGCSLVLTEESTDSTLQSNGRFLLSVESKNCSDPDYARIYVDGAPYDMTRYLSGNPDKYRFDLYQLQTASCHSSINYAYRAHTNLTFWTDCDTILPAGGSTIRLNVPKYGDLIWQVPGEPMHTTNGTIQFTWSTVKNKTVVIHNLKPGVGGVTINSVSLGSGNQNANYQLQGVPALPVTLGCGQSVSFNVNWNTNSGTATTDRGELILNTSAGVITVQLNGNG